jgi:hypothetical protein
MVVMYIHGTTIAIYEHGWFFGSSKPQVHAWILLDFPSVSPTIYNYQLGRLSVFILGYSLYIEPFVIINYTSLVSQLRTPQL